jgi:RNA polymerase sigma factor (sigma-70 family)
MLESPNTVPLSPEASASACEVPTCIEAGSACALLLLAKLAQAGQGTCLGAFSEFVEKYTDRILAFVRRRVFCAVTAESLTNDAISRLWEQLEKFNPQPTNPDPKNKDYEGLTWKWVYFRVLAVIGNYRRKNKQLHTGTDEDKLANIPDKTSEIETPELWVGNHQFDAEQLRAVVAALPLRYRVVMQLFLKGDSSFVIAVKLNITHALVRKRKSRACEMIRTRLGFPNREQKGISS